MEFTLITLVLVDTRYITFNYLLIPVHVVTNAVNDLIGVKQYKIKKTSVARRFKPPCYKFKFVALYMLQFGLKDAPYVCHATIFGLPDSET